MLLCQSIVTDTAKGFAMNRIRLRSFAGRSQVSALRALIQTTSNIGTVAGLLVNVKNSQTVAEATAGMSSGNNWRGFSAADAKAGSRITGKWELKRSLTDAESVAARKLASRYAGQIVAHLGYNTASAPLFAELATNNV